MNVAAEMRARREGVWKDNVKGFVMLGRRSRALQIQHCV
jgi:hypothetical protein